MKNNVLKGSIIIIFVILFFSCAISQISASDNSTQTMLTLSKGGVIMEYPSDWGNSKATSNDSVMAISKLDSIDSAGIGQININVEKRDIDKEFNSYLNSTYTSMQRDPSFHLISSGEVAVGDRTAMEYIYTSNTNGVERQHKAVWFDNGGQVYVVMYSAPTDQFEANSHVFDYILSQIKIP